MKKLFVSILVAGLLVSVGATQALAYTVNPTEQEEEETVDVPTQEEETVEDAKTEGEITTEEDIEEDTEEKTDEDYLLDDNMMVWPHNWFHKFVDANEDGICDNCNEEHHWLGFVDEDGDGICDNDYGRHEYVDENEDGICDSCNKNHHGKQFVDVNKDGICDRNVNSKRPMNIHHHKVIGKGHHH